LASFRASQLRYELGFIPRDAQGVRLITCRCLASIDANRFWLAAGFRRVGVERGARGPLFVWAKRLHVAEDLLAGKILPPIPLRSHTCKSCGRQCTYTRGPKGQLWKLCPRCVRAKDSSLGGPPETERYP